MFAILTACFLLAAQSPDETSADRAWTVLRTGLDSKNADQRAKAAHALGLLVKNARAQEWAEKALADAHPEVRMEAVSALGQIGAASARPELRDALNDKDIKVVVAAANALYVLKDPAAYDIYYELLTGERKSPGMMQSNLSALKNRREVEKLVFQTGIGFVPFGGVGYEAWKRVTEDPTTPIRVDAVEKLESDPDPKSGAALQHSCADKKWQIRAASADAIAKRGDPALLSAVTALLLDENDAVRSEAAAAVIRLTSQSRTTRPRRTNQK